MDTCPTPGCAHTASHAVEISGRNAHITRGPVCHDHALAMLAEADQRHDDTVTITVRPSTNLGATP